MNFCLLVTLGLLGSASGIYCTLNFMDAGSTDNDAQASADEAEAESADEQSGNGYEHVGIEGHGGIFKAFNWSASELRSVSLWHATAQYQNVIELIKEKLHAANLDETTKQSVERFIEKHSPPASVKSLLHKEDRTKIKDYHRSRNVEGILEIVRTRLSQLSPETRQE
ncbi:Protein C45E1.4, partial [Aphelenchoides avenae]